MNTPQKILIIGTVWPEPGSSAAGSRMIQLIQAFLKTGYEVTFASAAADSDFMVDLDTLGVYKQSIKLNCSSFDVFVGDLQPDLVMFDRFMTEEQFGWRVSDACPSALKLLDTEDLHCLRYARQKAFKHKKEFVLEDLQGEDIAIREIASIYRCDISMIISQFEMDILQRLFKVDIELLYYIPFLLPNINVDEVLRYKTFEERQHFISIGNFLHEPNWNAVLYLKEEIWPRIRKQLPQAELHVFGAYPSQKVWELNNPKQGFLIKGRTEDVKAVMLNARVCLAPLRFGAGLKGKLIDSMLYGTPNVTTSIGAESMSLGRDWNGFIEDDTDLFVDKSVLLYNNREVWTKSVKDGVQIVNQNFSFSIAESFLNHVKRVKKNLEMHRMRNFMGKMLQHHQMASTRFMSKWIEEKNKIKAESE